MVSSRKFTVPATAALTCLMAVGCSSGNDPFARLPNRPPIIVKDSLTWMNAETMSWGDKVIQWGVEYKYSVRAIDPDVGDKVIKYFWRFGGDAETAIADPRNRPEPTDVPSISHIFLTGDVGIVSVKASDGQMIGPEVSFPVPLPEEPEE